MMASKLDEKQQMFFGVQPTRAIMTYGFMFKKFGSFQKLRTYISKICEFLRFIKLCPLKFYFKYVQLFILFHKKQILKLRKRVVWVWKCY